MKKNPSSGIVKISSGQYEYSLDLYSNVEEEVYYEEAVQEEEMVVVEESLEKGTNIFIK